MISISYYYGYLQGNRGEATRCGSKGSGINAHLRSWDNDVYCNLENDNDKDKLVITLPVGINCIINGKKLKFSDKEMFAVLV